MMKVGMEGATAAIALIVKRFELTVTSSCETGPGVTRVDVEVDETFAQVLQLLCRDVKLEFDTRL
jgi:hypothetical protein